MVQNCRQFLTLAFAGLASAMGAGQAEAVTITAANDSGLRIAGGLWETFADATKGTDPSTSVTALPVITPAIRALAGQEIRIEGYLQPITMGFGRSEYVLSRMPYHCPFCYSGGRASLILVRSQRHLELKADMPVALRGRLVLQERDPEDYYFQLIGAVPA